MQSPLLGLSSRHVKNSSEFSHLLDSLQLEDQDMMVSFDIVSLFTSALISDTLELLNIVFKEEILVLFHHILNCTYFSFSGQLFEQTDVVVVDSPLSPVITNFFMEKFEEKALELASFIPYMN
jgi:hypothetical protein